MNNACTQNIDDAIKLLEEMKSILTDGDSDAPQAFLEAAFDVQDHINQAVAAALVPLLQPNSGKD